MYKEKLILLLKALEVKEIEELIEQPPEYLAKIGVVIARAAKIGAKVASQQAVTPDKLCTCIVSDVKSRAGELYR